MKFEYLITFMIFVSCQQSKTVTGKYESFWGETHFTLELYSNYKFKYKIEGHLGFDNIEGKYSMIKDTVLLEGENINKLSNKFLIIDDNCFIDIETRYDYCKREGETWETNQYPLKQKTL